MLTSHTSSRSSPAHNKAQQPLPLLDVGSREAGLLEIIHYSAPNSLGIRYRLQLVTVFESGNTVSRVDGSASDHEAVILSRWISSACEVTHITDQ